MRSSAVSTSRALDAVYDPVYSSGTAGPAYVSVPASSSSSLASTSFSSSLYRPNDTAPFNVRRPDGSVALVSLSSTATATTSDRATTHGTASATANLRSAVQGPNRLKYLKRPVRAFVQPAGQHSAASNQHPAGGLLSHSLTAASPFAHYSHSAHTQPSSGEEERAAAAAAASGALPSGSSLSASSVSTVGSQSLYRESSSQTLPYSPDVLLDPHPSPDVLELLRLQSSLTYANGMLPAMLDAVEAVEAARAQRAWEAQLPSLSTAGGYEARRRMVEEREWTEWKAKEAGIRAEQERAMLAIIAKEDDRAARQQRRMAEAVDAKSREMEMQADAADERRREEKRRAVRVLGKQRLMAEKQTAHLTGGLIEVDAHSGQFALLEEEKTGSASTGRRSRRSAAALSSSASQSVGGTSSSSSALLELSRADAVFGAVDFASEVYAPLQRNGAAVAYAHKRTVVDFDIPALSDYATLTNMHNRAITAGRAGDRLRLPSIDRPLNRREARERQHLMRVDAQIAEQKEQTSLEQQHSAGGGSSGITGGRWAAAAAASGKQQQAQQSGVPSAAVNVYKHFAPVQRAPTPSLPLSQPAEDGQRVAVTLLQRLIRGRAQQNQLISAARSRQHLITEMVQVAKQNSTHSGHAEDTSSHSTIRQQQQHLQGDEADEASSPVSPDARPAIDASLPASEASSMSPSLLFDVLVGSLLSDSVSSLLAGRQQSEAVNALSRYMQHALFVRRVREAEEAGRRQAQDELRQRQDAHYASTRSTLKQHTAAHHTQLILQRAVDAHVSQQQQQQTEQHSVASLSDVGDDDPDVVVAELLRGVVWPEVEQRAARDSVDDRRFLDAAHRAAQSAIAQSPVQV